MGGWLPPGGSSVSSATATNGGAGNAGKVLALDASGKAAGRVLETDGAKLDGIISPVLTKLTSYFDVGNFHIDQPIMMADLTNLIFQVPGVMSINRMNFTNVSGVVNNLQYSNVRHDPHSNTKVGMLFPPAGGIFEVRYPQVDLVGKATV